VEITVEGANAETGATLSFRQEVTAGGPKIEVKSLNFMNGSYATDPATYQVVLPVGDYSVVASTPDKTTLVLLLTFATQRVAAVFFGKEISGFFGMLVATPLGYLIQLRFKGPPAMVTFLPSFWLLVPGVLGLLSLKRMLGDPAAGVERCAHFALRDGGTVLAQGCEGVLRYSPVEYLRCLPKSRS
jgi:hypothetical protein